MQSLIVNRCHVLSIVAEKITSCKLFKVNQLDKNCHDVTKGEKWSEREDLNLRLLRPERSALARLSHAPT